MWKRTFSPGLTTVAALATAIVAGSSMVFAVSAGAGSVLAVGPTGEHWVASWTSTQQLTEPSNMPPAPFTQNGQVMVDATVRQTIRVSVGGPRFRLHLSNVFGGAVLPITAASVALPTGGLAGVSGIQTGTARAVAFGGQPSVTIPVGEEAVSDPLDFTVASGSNLTVTLYLARGQASSNVTSHPGSRTTSYLVRGNHLEDVSLFNATPVDHWYFLSGLDVWASASTGAAVMLGDSLTDGRGSTTNGNDRWPDKLFDRLQRQSATANVAVVNQAAGGNAVLSGGLGPTAVSRFDRDVLGQSGVKWLIVFEGVNDLGANGSTKTANDLIAAYQQFITKAHAAGIKAYGATITPFGGSGYDDSAGTHEAARQLVNSWIRTSDRFDAVVDFDQAVRDPANSRRIRSSFDSGDHLHLNPAGYQALADSIPDNLFTEPTVPPTTALPTTALPTSTAPTSCRVTYTAGTWGTGLTASITITNTATTRVDGWILAFTLPGGQTVTSAWNATIAPTSGTVTARNVSYNAAIEARQSISIGFRVSHNGNTNTPTSFTLNGRACATG